MSAVSGSHKRTTQNKLSVFPDALDFAKGDVIFLSDATMTAGSAVLTSASGLFKSTDVGKVFVVPGAGPANMTLSSSILSYQSPTQVTLTNNALSSIAGQGAKTTTTITVAMNAVTRQITIASAAGLPPAATAPLSTQYHALLGIEMVVVVAGAGTTTLTLLRGTNETLPVPHPNGSNLTWFLPNAYFGTDDTANIQAALNAETVLHFPSKTFLIQGYSATGDQGAYGGVKPQSGSTLYFHGSATLMCLPDPNIEAASLGARTCVLNLRARTDIEIYGGLLKGDRFYHNPRMQSGDPNFTGEFGFGAFVSASKRITFYSTVFRDFWGDGVLVYGDGPGDPNASETIRFMNTVATNNRRNGLSITNGYVEMINSEWKFTNGTNPECGWDAEPDYATDVINIHAYNVKTRHNNGMGHQVVPYFLGATKGSANNPGSVTPTPIEVVVSGFTSDQDRYNGVNCVAAGGGISTEKIPGRILFENGIIRQPNRSGVTVSRWGPTAPRLLFNNVQVIDPNRLIVIDTATLNAGGYTFEQLVDMNGFSQYITATGSTLTVDPFTDTGLVEYINCHVEDTRTAPQVLDAFSFFSYDGIKNVNHLVRNPTSKNTVASFRQVNCNSGFGTVVYDTAPYFNPSGSYGLDGFNGWVTSPATNLAVARLPHANRRPGFEVTVRNDNNLVIQVGLGTDFSGTPDSGDVFIGDDIETTGTGDAKLLVLRKPNDFVTLRSLGNHTWLVTSKKSTWAKSAKAGYGAFTVAGDLTLGGGGSGSRVSIGFGDQQTGWGLDIGTRISGAFKPLFSFEDGASLGQSGHFTAIRSTDATTYFDLSDNLLFLGSPVDGYCEVAIQNHNHTINASVLLKLSVQGDAITGGSGNPFIWFNNFGVADWSMGIDVNDYNKFKISHGATLGVNDAVTINHGQVGIGPQLPLANLHIMQGTATIPPLMLNPSTLTTSPVNNAWEWDGTNIWITTSAGVRSKIGDPAHLNATDNYGVLPALPTTLAIGGGGSVANSTSLTWGDGSGVLLNFLTNVSGSASNVFSFSDRGIFKLFTRGSFRPYVSFFNAGVQEWSMGMDATGKFCLDASSPPGSSSSITVSTVGQVNFPLKPLLPASGGTGANTTPGVNEIPYGDGSKLLYLSANSTSFKFLSANASGGLSWVTAYRPGGGVVATTDGGLGASYATLEAIATAIFGTAAAATFKSGLAVHPHTHNFSYLAPTSGTATPSTTGPEN